MSPPHARAVYYGWRVVAALFLCTFAVFGVSIYSFIIFTQPLAAQFGWSPAETGSLVSAMWLVAPLALLAGTLTKISNPWRLAVLGLLLEAATLSAMLLVQDIWQLYVLRILMGVGKVTAIVATPLIVSRWFTHRFATAMALVWAGGSAGGLVMAPLTEALSSAFGWKPAALLIAGGLVMVAVVLGLFARGPASPEELEPGAVAERGQASGEQTAASAPPLQRPDWRSIRFSTATSMFVAIAGAGMGAIAALAQQPAFLESAGFTPGAAAMMLGLTAGGCLAGAASIGWMLDRFYGVWSSLTVTAAIFSGLVILAVLPNTAAMSLGIAGALCLGYGVGAAEVLWLTLTKRQFGAALFPLTYGGWYFALQLGYAMGGGFGGLGFEHFGPTGFLTIVAIMYLPAAICSLSIKASRHPAAARH